MTTLHSLDELASLPGPAHLAIGFFDGVHLGHQEVIRRAQATAAAQGGTAIALTFDPHPVHFLRPSSAPALLTSPQHKSRLLEALGLSHLLVLPFDQAFAALSPEAFISLLVQACHPLASITVGHNWGFGKGRGGNLQTLTALGAQLGFLPQAIDPVLLDGSPVSSTRVRQAVAQGDFPAAARLLGRPYSIQGTVTPGRQLARKLGFPTANLPLPSLQLPPLGVYAIRATSPHHTFLGVANLGRRPTVERDQPAPCQLEAHLFDFHGDLYGQTLDVCFLHHLRDELRLDSLEALQAQIARDTAQARHLLGPATSQAPT